MRAFLFALLLAAPVPAIAGEALDAARRAYANLEYEKVPGLLEKALSQTRDPREEARIYELWAHVHVAYEEEESARDAFVQVLRREPDFELPEGTSPKVFKAFSAARAQIRNGGVPPEDAPAPGVATTTPVYMEWWVWGAAGVVLIGGGVLAWAVLRDSTPEHDYGPIVLQ